MGIVILPRRRERRRTHVAGRSSAPGSVVLPGDPGSGVGPPAAGLPPGFAGGGPPGLGGNLPPGLGGVLPGGGPPPGRGRTRDQTGGGNSGGSGDDLFTDFSNQAAGDPLAGFTTITGSNYTAGNGSMTIADEDGAIGGRVVAGQRTTDGYSTRAYDPVGVIQPSDTAEILAKLKVSATFDYSGGVAILASADATTGAGYYVLFTSGTTLTLRKLAAGGFSSPATTAFSHSANTYYWIRARKTGNNIRARAWADSGSEPGAWAIDYTDGSPIGTAGYAGLAQRSRFSVVTFDYVAFGLGGDSAPSPA